MERYRNANGTYTSPKNGKIFKSAKALRAHLSFRRSERAFNFTQLNQKTTNCSYCQKPVSRLNVSRHENHCFLNPTNIQYCKICQKPIKDFKKSKGTCSRSCANKHFKSGENNGNWKGTRYVSLCFSYHKKECVVCGESKIVAVHHFNEDHTDNRPENLVPLCPTHHQYVHSRYKHEIIETINKYIEEFIKNRV